MMIIPGRLKNPICLSLHSARTASIRLNNKINRSAYTGMGDVSWNVYWQRLPRRCFCLTLIYLGLLRCYPFYFRRVPVERNVEEKLRAHCAHKYNIMSYGSAYIRTYCQRSMCVALHYSDGAFIHKCAFPM